MMSNDKVNELSKRFTKKYGIDTNDKRFCTHAGMRGGRLHVPDSQKHAFLTQMQRYIVLYNARQSFSERAKGVLRPAFFDCDFQSCDTSHVLMQRSTYVRLVKECILPSLYECYTKEAIVRANIKILIAFPNELRRHERLNDNTFKYKFGAHIRCLQQLTDGCIVGGGPYCDVATFDIIRQLVIAKMHNVFPEITGPMAEDLLDVSPYENGGMRMLLLTKGKKKCKLHVQPEHVQECEYCDEDGTVYDNSYYVPGVIVDAQGNECEQPWDSNNYVKMWRETSIYVPFDTLEELYEVLPLEQQLVFAPPHGYAATANIRKRVDVANITNDDGITIRVNKRMKTIKATQSGRGHEILNQDLKDALESWIWAMFPLLYCPVPPTATMPWTRYHRDICQYQLEYLHRPNRWKKISVILGCKEEELKAYWKTVCRVQVASAKRMNALDYTSVICVKTTGQFSNACGNAAQTNRSAKHFHDSASNAYFQLKRLNQHEVHGVQRCFANNKGDECLSSKRCTAFKSKPRIVPSWIALGLFLYKPTNVLVPSSTIPVSGMISTMLGKLRKDGQFRSMRKIKWGGGNFLGTQ